MKHVLGVSVVALGLMSGAAFAQSVIAPPPVPPVGTLSTTRTTHAQDAYGNQTDSKSTSYRDSMGASQDAQTTTTTVAAPPPPPPPTTTTTTTTESSSTGPQ